MKIASYNIMSGGFNSYASTATQPERLSLLQEAIAKIDADIIGLIDTFRWKQLFSEQELSALFAYPEVFQITLNDPIVDSQVGLTLLSKMPMNCKEVRIYDRSCIQATIQDKNAIIDIFVAYFNHKDESIRHKQANALVKLLQERPTILMGDLNAISSRDIPLVQALVKDLPQTEETQQLFKELFQATAIDLLKTELSDASDINEGYSATAHTKMKLPHPVAKVDYIFTSPGIEVESFQTYYDEFFDRASDHYPIAAEVKLK